MEEDFALYLEAQNRLRDDAGTRLTTKDVYGDEYIPADDVHEPEFE